MGGKTALVVIDVQNWEIDGHTKRLPEKLADYIDKNGGAYDFVLFTKARNTKQFSLYKLRGVRSGMCGKQIEIVPELGRFLNKKNVFEKTTYSAFKSRKFLAFLRRNGVGRIDLCGINTDKCVVATAYEAFDLGYEIHILHDLVGSVISPAKHKAALLLMGDLVPKRASRS